MTNIILKPDSLWTKVKSQTKFALDNGSLQPINTDSEIIEDNGIPFLVRIVSNLVRKDKATKKRASTPNFNPFLPYESDLFVTDISDTHLCLLNKYNVIDYHLLIVTREFEEQETWLNFADFIALLAAMAQFDGLAFYNSGKIAGASVRHKHLQLIPLETIPIEAVLKDSVVQIEGFPFKHGYTKLTLSWQNSLEEAAKITLKNYQKLLELVALLPGEPYNFLMTKDWMLIVPRSQEDYQGISINSLGFAGAMLVRNQEQLKIVKEEQPLNILQKVSK